jgi:hypothetical protein
VDENDKAEETGGAEDVVNHKLFGLRLDLRNLFKFL